MLYTWLFYEFTSDQGTTYRVNINADGPSPATSGDAKETGCHESGFTLEYDGKSQDPFQPVVGSKVSVPLQIGMARHNDEDVDEADEDSEVFVANELIKALNEEDEGFFTLEILRQVDEDYTLFWAGVILGEQTKQAIAPYPRTLNLTAVDDLANLQYIDYDDFVGAESFKNAIIKLILQTRMAGKYWDNNDVFVNMQTYFTTQSAIDAGNNQAYDYHRFISNEMRVPKTNGVEVPRPAGEVLEAIAELFMASIFQSDGQWWVIPRAQVTFTNTSYTLFSYTKLGTNLSGTNGAPLLSNFQINPSTATKVLAGGDDSYLHPVRQVTRDYRFSGSLKLFESLAEGSNNNTYVQLSEILNEEFDNSLFASLEGTVFTFRFFWQITQPANGALTGSERVVRYRFRFKIKVGDLYLERTLNNGNTLPFTVCGATNVPTVQLLQPWASNSGQTAFLSWESDNTVRVDLISPTLDAVCGGFTTNGGQVNLPPLPSTESGVTVELESVTPLDADGNAFTTPGVTPTGQNFLASLGFWIINGNGTDTVGYEATNDNNARDVIDLPEAIFGDQISTWNTRGAIRRINNTDYTTQEWRRLGSTDQEFVNQLLVNTYGAIRHNARQTRRMTIFSPEVRHFWQRVRYEVATWVITSFKFTANFDEYDIELIELKLSGTQTSGTTPSAGLENTSPSVPTQPDTQVPDLQGIAENNSITQELAQTTAEKVFALQPDGVSGLFLKNAPSDDHGVTYTPPKVGNDQSALLPLGFNWFVIVNTLLTSTSERYVTFNTRDNAASIDAAQTMITAFGGRVASVIIRSSVAADVTLRVYVNTSLIVTKTSTYAAGGRVTENLLPDDVIFNEADRLSISFETDTQPNDISATAVLAQY